ncbi:MAG TPA: carboxylesterase family protein, partial [Enhygromyxa sp.]|nr:carboxylesterase family protein [Enhygromyxa sp.]
MPTSPSRAVERAAARLVLASALTSVACRSEPEPRSSAEPDPAALVVATDRGRVRGTTDGGAQAFRGIPYAAAPTGERRFRAPEPPAAWDGIRDATAFGNKCPQRGVLDILVGDEDCLNLNVWRPSTPASDPRPVLVFIHGGANVVGSGSDPLHSGRRLAHDHELIVVTFNYRLGLLGFLAHPRLTAESGTSGNWAYLDQIAALQWVARNIAAFGGDPKRVTIVGESAGALGVCVLLTSPLAAGLFTAAIMQSGGCDVAPLTRREQDGERLANISGCARAPDMLECLRGISVTHLLALTPAPAEISSWALPTGGAVDGVVLPTSPWQAFAAGTHAVVPTLVGSNADETELFAPKTIDSCSAYQLAIQKSFGVSSEDVLAEYPCADYPNPRQAYVAATTDAIFDCQARRILRSLAPAARESGTPLFRYLYAYTRADPAVRELRAFHGGEIQLLFGTMPRIGYKLPDAEKTLSQIIQTSWAAIARSGSPIHAATPGWTA